MIPSNLCRRADKSDVAAMLRRFMPEPIWKKYAATAANPWLAEKAAENIRQTLAVLARCWLLDGAAAWTWRRWETKNACPLLNAANQLNWTADIIVPASINASFGIDGFLVRHDDVDEESGKIAVPRSVFWNRLLASATITKLLCLNHFSHHDDHGRGMDEDVRIAIDRAATAARLSIDSEMPLGEIELMPKRLREELGLFLQLLVNAYAYDAHDGLVQAASARGRVLKSFRIGHWPVGFFCHSPRSLLVIVH